MTMTSILTVKNLKKSFGKKIAVGGVSFEVRKNEIVGLLGPNGAGKTTIINMILGVLEPTSGLLLIEENNILTQRSSALLHANFAAVYAQLPGNLSVSQNLRIFGLLYGVKPLEEKINSLLSQFNLLKFKDTKCGLLSSGEQTRVCLAKAMLNNPHLLLLDEPTASIDPSSAQDIRRSIREFASKGNSGVLWTSHNMYEVEEVCDRVLFILDGKILLEGNPRTLPKKHGKKTLEELFISIARKPIALSEESL